MYVVPDPEDQLHEFPDAERDKNRTEYHQQRDESSDGLEGSASETHEIFAMRLKLRIVCLRRYSP